VSPVVCGHVDDDANVSRRRRVSTKGDTAAAQNANSRYDARLKAQLFDISGRDHETPGGRRLATSLTIVPSRMLNAAGEWLSISICPTMPLDESRMSTTSSDRVSMLHTT